MGAGGAGELGRGYTDPTTYDVNTNVSFFSDWITTNIALSLTSTEYMTTLPAAAAPQTLLLAPLRDLLYRKYTNWEGKPGRSFE